MSIHRWFFLEFLLPGILLLGCLGLLLMGHDSEIKSILAMAAGWLFRSSIVNAKH